MAPDGKDGLACESREDATPACIGDFEVTPREGGHAHDLPFLPIPIDPKRIAAETPVRDLNFDLKRLQAAHDDGSHGTRTARSYALAQIADTLHELGFKGLRATGLRRKHVVALVKEWKRQGRSIGTIKNRTAHIRWWAKRVGRPGVVPANGELGIANREFVTNQDRSAVLDPEKLARVKDPHVAMALLLEAAFGLRREEAIKFTPVRDDRGGCIRLKGSTTKGGRPREVPVRNEAQRATPPPSTSCRRTPRHARTPPCRRSRGHCAPCAPPDRLTPSPSCSGSAPAPGRPRPSGLAAPIRRSRCPTLSPRRAPRGPHRSALPRRLV